MTPHEIRLAISAMQARVVLSLTTYAEAAGEPEAGQAAVVWVIKNRAARWRKTIQAVCLAPNQFWCWWGSDANTARLLEMSETILTGRLPQQAGWLQVSAIAHRALLGAIPDPTGGATFYCADYVLTDPARADEWFARQVRAGVLRESARIGRHVFFTEHSKS